MTPNLDMEILVLESVLANATDQYQFKAGLMQAVKLLKELKQRLDREERDGGALASAVSKYIDGGCNHEEALQAAISKWSQYGEEEAPK